MKAKSIIAALLIAALVTFTTPAQTNDPPPDPHLVLIGCMVLIVGGIIIAGIWYACKKIPDPNACPCGCGVKGCTCMDNNDPTTTQQLPPIGAIATNPPGPVTAMRAAMLEYHSYANTNGGVMLDDQGRTWEYQSYWKFTLQTSTTLSNWTGLATIYGWQIGNGALVSLRQGNQTLTNCYYTSAGNTNNYLPMDLLGGDRRFYRVSCK